MREYGRGCHIQHGRGPIPFGMGSPEECVNPSKGECSGSEVGGELIGTCMTKIDSQFHRRRGWIFNRCDCAH